MSSNTSSASLWGAAPECRVRPKQVILMIKEIKYESDLAIIDTQDAVQRLSRNSVSLTL